VTKLELLTVLLSLKALHDQDKPEVAKQVIQTLIDEAMDSKKKSGGE